MGLIMLYHISIHHTRNEVLLMMNKRMIRWALLLALAVGLLSGCDGSQNPTVPQQLPETIPTTAAGPTETQPPQTEAATQPTAPESVPLELSPAERCEINIFLSNFSEQWFHEGSLWDDDPSNQVFYADTGSVAQIVDFAWIFAKLNLNEELEVVVHDGNYYYGFKLGILDPIAERFFGRTLTEAELGSMESEYYFLLDGLVCGPAADGETYMNMTVTERMYDLGDGTLRAEFAIYDAWAFADVGGTVFGKDLYYLTGEQAQIDPDLQLHLKGTAVVRPQTLDNGQESYMLVSYELYEPAA